MERHINVNIAKIFAKKINDAYIFIPKDAFIPKAKFCQKLSRDSKSPFIVLQISRSRACKELLVLGIAKERI